MLYRNEIFSLNGQRHRLLHTEESTDRAWTINMEDTASWPVQVTWSQLLSAHEAERKNLPACFSNATEKTPLLSLAPTPAMRKVKDAALERLGNLIKTVPAIYDRDKRGQLVRERALEAGCSKTSLNKDLRRYWLGGQCSSALLGDFHRCGITQSQGTAGRGRRTIDGHAAYQLGEGDEAYFRRWIEQHYLKDGRRKIPHTFQRLLEHCYQRLDGNGQPWLLPAGERPSLRQFEHFLRKNYPLEMRLRKRHGDKEFELDHRAKVGTILADCLGVGHYYEADATIADVYLVASEDVRQIVGKPTLYLIIDRKSRLIVGWYVGLENASWACAKQAILSISQDKAAMCARYGVHYEPEDWPAHMVFPKEFLADRGELFKRTSSQIADDLEVNVTNVPAKRGDWKPVVECGFKQTRVALEDGTPGFDPPENAKKRQGKHYEKDACLTLQQFTTIILNCIIAHNRAQMPAYELSLKELGDNVEPSPIGLWNHNIRERAGLLTRFDEERVRLALLPRGEATVTEEGILFNKCLYTCAEAMAGGWFVRARRKRFKIGVSYDSRLVDTLYVYNPEKRGHIAECTLTARSERYRGFSVHEVAVLERIRALLQPSIQQSRLQTRSDMHRANDPIVAAGRQKLASEGKGVTRSARKADTKEARAHELRKERQATATPTSAEHNHAGAGATGQVYALPIRAKGQPISAAGVGATSDITSHEPHDRPKASSMAERLRQMRERVTNG